VGGASGRAKQGDDPVNRGAAWERKARSRAPGRSGRGCSSSALLPKVSRCSVPPSFPPPSSQHSTRLDELGTCRPGQRPRVPEGRDEVAVPVRPPLRESRVHQRLHRGVVPARADGVADGHVHYREGGVGCDGCPGGDGGELHTLHGPVRVVGGRLEDVQILRGAAADAHHRVRGDRACALQPQQRWVKEQKAA